MNFDVERKLIETAEALQEAADNELRRRADPVIDALCRVGRFEDARRFVHGVPSSLAKAFMYDRIRQHEQRN